MKRIFTIILLFAPLLCFAQTYAEMQEAKEAEVFEEDRKRQQRYEAYMEELNENARRQRERLEQFQVNFLQEEEQRARDKARREAELQAQRERAKQEAQLRAKQQREAQLRAQQQAERKRQIAAYNQQVAARNAQIRAHNEQLREEQAEQRREAARQRAEAELRRKEAIRQQVTQETYNRLEQQTRTKEHIAADAAGAGADRLARNHPVSRYETDIPVGGGRPTSQIDHLPRQKFEIPTGSRILDPDKVYYCNMPQNEGDVYLFYQDASSPVPPSVDNSAPWLDFCDNMPSKRAAAHLALMRQACGGDMPTTIKMFDDYTAFLSSDGNTVISVKKDGSEMTIWHLEEGRDDQIKSDVYAKLNAGIIKEKVKGKHNDDLSIKRPQIEDVTLSVNSATITASHKNGATNFKVSKKDNLASIEEVRPFKEDQNDQKKESSAKSDVGVAFGLEGSINGLTSIERTKIVFMGDSHRHAYTYSIKGSAGYKVQIGVEGGASTKKGLKANAGVSYDGLKAELQGGYIYVGEKKIYEGTAGAEASAGYSVGFDVSPSRLKVKGGIASLGGFYNVRVIPLSFTEQL